MIHLQVSPKSSCGQLCGKRERKRAKEREREATKHRQCLRKRGGQCSVSGRGERGAHLCLEDPSDQRPGEDLGFQLIRGFGRFRIKGQGECF